MISAFIPAGLLALVTLGVFYVTQNYGPESAVRRFHTVGLHANSVFNAGQPFNYQLLQPYDLLELAEVTSPSVRDPNVARLMDDWVRPVGLYNARYEIARIDYIHPDQATVAVIYNYPMHPPSAMVWIATLKNNTWKVEVDLTAKIVREMGGQ